MQRGPTRGGAHPSAARRSLQAPDRLFEDLDAEGSLTKA